MRATNPITFDVDRVEKDDLGTARLIVNTNVNDPRTAVSLIEAAPALLAAVSLRRALEDNDVHPFDTRWKEIVKMERAALSKATA